MKLSRIFIPVCAMLFAACTSENDSFIENTETSETSTENVSEATHVVFTASTDEGDNITRATFKNLVMGWETNDKISVVQTSRTITNTSRTDNLTSTLLDVKEIEGKNSQLAKFEGDISNVTESDKFWAVYSKKNDVSYSITNTDNTNLSWSGTTYTHKGETKNFSGEIPYAQTVLAGKEVDENAMYMTAYTTAEEKIFRFKNLTALLKINIKSGDGATGKKVKYVRFVANDKNAKLTGAFTATIGTDGVANVTPGTTNNSVLLQANGDALNGTYYISVLPATLTGGFKILLETECTNYSQEIYVRKSSGNITLNRNEIVDLGSYDATTTGTVNGAKGIKESFISDVVDLDLPSATLWSAKNIAAGDKIFVDNVSDYGQYYCWGEDFGFDEKPTTNATNTRDSYKTTTINRVSYDTKLRYEWETYKWAPGSSNVYDGFGVYTALGKYNPTDGKTELDPEDDIAHIKTGGQFCMPTGDQITELKDNTARSNRVAYATGSLNGYSYASILNSNKKLWLPAAGIFYGALFDGGTFIFSSKTSHQSDVGTYAYYWSKSIYTGGNNYQQAYCLDTNTGNNGRDRRYAARTIRPVLNK